MPLRCITFTMVSPSKKRSAKFEEGIAQIRVNGKNHFYTKEDFTFIQHERILNIIKARDCQS